MIKISRSLMEGFCEFSGCELRNYYSGRRMYGKKCFGVIGNYRSLCKMIAIMGSDSQENYDLALQLIESLQTDSMGLDLIFYFPGFELFEES